MLAENTALPPLRKKDFFEGQKEKKGKEEKKEKAPKGETQRISLELFRNGKTIAEIAKERNFAVSTIEGHLTGFVKTGEVAVTELVPPEKIAVILPLVEAIINGTNTSISSIKDQLGRNYSYMEIKAVLNDFIRTMEK
jgi:uncharacterized protein YpbB